jgi:hypothetical protein
MRRPANTADAEARRDAEIEGILDHLAAFPGVNHEAVPTALARAVLLKVHGQQLVAGKIWDIKVAPLGAGVQRLILKEVSNA